jgi:hypothetical protein
MQKSIISNSNLLALCKSCHRNKSAAELNDGSNVKLDETESSYSNELETIISSSLAQSLAFAEKYKQTNRNSRTMCIDLNKNRKNQLYYSNHDYPVLIALDKNQTGAGIYYLGSNPAAPEIGCGICCEFCCEIAIFLSSLTNMESEMPLQW